MDPAVRMAAFLRAGTDRPAVRHLPSCLEVGMRNDPRLEPDRHHVEAEEAHTPMIDARFRVAEIPVGLAAVIHDGATGLPFDTPAALVVDHIDMVGQDPVVGLAQEFDEGIDAVDTAAQHHQCDALSTLDDKAVVFASLHQQAVHSVTPETTDVRWLGDAATK